MLMDYILMFRDCCEACGIAPGNAVIGLLSAVFIAVPTIKHAIRLACWTGKGVGKGVAGALGWMFRATPPSTTAEAILSALDSRQARWEMFTWTGAKDPWQTLRMPEVGLLVGFKFNDGDGPLTRIQINRLISSANGGTPNVRTVNAYSVLSGRDLKLIDRKARATIARLEQEAADYDRMEILDALEGVVSDPRKTCTHL